MAQFTFNPAMPQQGKATTQSVRENFLALKAMIDGMVPSSGPLGYYRTTEAKYYDGLAAGTLRPGLYEFLRIGISSKPLSQTETIPLSTSGDYTGTVRPNVALEDGQNIYAAIRTKNPIETGAIGIFDAKSGLLKSTVPFTWDPGSGMQAYTYFGCYRAGSAFGGDNWMYFTNTTQFRSANWTGTYGTIFAYNYRTGEKKVLGVPNANNDVQLKATPLTGGGHFDRYTDKEVSRDLRPSAGGTFTIPTADAKLAYFQDGQLKSSTFNPVLSYTPATWLVYNEKLYGLIGGKSLASANNSNYSDRLGICDTNGNLTESAPIPGDVVIRTQGTKAPSVAVGNKICILAHTNSTTTWDPNPSSYGLKAFVYDTANNSWMTSSDIDTGVAPTNAQQLLLSTFGYEVGGKAYFQAYRGTLGNLCVVEVDPTNGNATAYSVANISMPGTTNDMSADFRLLKNGKFFGIAFSGYQNPPDGAQTTPYLFDPVTKQVRLGTTFHSTYTYPFSKLSTDEKSIWVKGVSSSNDGFTRQISIDDLSTVKQYNVPMTEGSWTINRSTSYGGIYSRELSGKQMFYAEGYIFMANDDTGQMSRELRASEGRFVIAEESKTAFIAYGYVVEPGKPPPPVTQSSFRYGDYRVLRVASGDTEL